MKRVVVPVAVLGMVAAVAVQSAPATGESKSIGVVRAAALGKLKPAVLKTTTTVNGKATAVTKQMPFLSGGVIATAREAMGVGGSAASAASAAAAGNGNVNISSNSVGCRNRNPDGNQRVNTDCFFRRQAETDIAFNPADPTNLLAGQNDSRAGWNQTGFDFSVNNGLYWGDELPPHR